MAEPIFIILPLALAIIGFIVYESYKKNARIRSRIVNSFGKEPDEIYSGKFESIKIYFNKRRDNSTNKYLIDGITWNDLEMDNVFKRINACQSSAGEENLYAMLHEISFDSKKLESREELIKHIDSNESLRIKLQMEFAKLGKRNFNGFSSFIYESDSKTLKNAWIYKILAIVPASCVLLMFINFQIGFTLFIFSAMINGFVYYSKKNKLEKELNALKYIASVLYSSKRILSIKDEKLSGFTEDLKKLYDKFKSVEGAIRGLKGGAGQAISNVDFILDYLKLLVMYDFIRYNKAVEQIRKNKESFFAIYEYLGEIDVAVSVLSFRKSLSPNNWSIPKFTDDNDIKIGQIYHPLIKDPVVNTIEIKKNSIITGSNASGKSTFTKAIAINIILSQTIYTCTAKQFCYKPSFPMSSMAVKDDVVLGESYFIAEIKSLKRILDTINDEIRCICFIDEILRGTNTVERIAASSSIIENLSSKNCICIIATHDIELTNILKSVCDNYHFSEQVNDNGIDFDYTIKPGPSKTRNAIKLLELMSFDENIIKNSNDMAESFLEKEHWSTV